MDITHQDNFDKLKRRLGANLIDITPLSRYITYIMPSHISEKNIYLLRYSDRFEVLKTGNSNKILSEFTALTSLMIKSSKNIFKCIKFPEPLSMFSIEKDTSALVSSFEGLHTIESIYLKKNYTEMLLKYKKILNELKNNEIIWLTAAPKNIILSKSIYQYCLVDWEDGYNTIETLDFFTFYRRAMHLQKEWSDEHCKLLPYWATHWPSPYNLLRHVSNVSLLKNIDVDMGSRRLNYLVNLCRLPTTLTDAQYYRMLIIIGSLSKRIDNFGNSLVYAADIISDNIGSNLRTLISMLYWCLKKNKFIKLANDIYECVISYSNAYVNDILANRVVYNLNLSNDIDNIAQQYFKTNFWVGNLAEECSEYIYNGENNIEFEIDIILHL